LPYFRRTPARVLFRESGKTTLQEQVQRHCQTFSFMVSAEVVADVFARHARRRTPQDLQNGIGNGITGVMSSTSSLTCSMWMSSFRDCYRDPQIALSRARCDAQLCLSSAMGKKPFFGSFTVEAETCALCGT
jgi:hypothetical protein